MILSRILLIGAFRYLYILSQFTIWSHCWTHVFLWVACSARGLLCFWDWYSERASDMLDTRSILGRLWDLTVSTYEIFGYLRAPSGMCEQTLQALLITFSHSFISWDLPNRDPSFIWILSWRSPIYNKK